MNKIEKIGLAMSMEKPNITNKTGNSVGDKIIEVAAECWMPITPERILAFPIKVIPGITRSADNHSFATDADGVEWICGFFDGNVCRVAVSKPQQSNAVN